jgi:membrane associated rhomboid family serine protease
MRVTAVGVIAAVTVVASLAVAATVGEGYAAFVAGVIPARLSGAELPPGYWFVPAALTPLTAALIHSGPLHLVFNLVMLLYTGKQTERVLGPWLVLLLYAVGAYAAAFAQWFPDPESQMPMVGASGALSAFVGAYSLYYGRARAKALGPIPAEMVQVIWLAVAWTAINYAFALAVSGPGFQIAWEAHVGGFLAGLALARPLFKWRWRKA